MAAMNQFGRRIQLPPAPLIPTGSSATHTESPPPFRAVPTPTDMAAPAPRTPAVPTLEEKQERQRMHVRRSYYKKRGYVRGLKEQVDKLEQEYAQALAAHPDKRNLIAAAVAATPPSMVALAREAVSSPTMASNSIVAGLQDTGASSSDDTGGISPDSMSAEPSRLWADASPTSAETVQDFVQLSALRDSLRTENDELKKALVRYANFVRRVNQSIIDAHNEMDEDPAPHLDVLDFSITSGECRYIALQVCEEAKRFIDSEGCLTTGMSLFGWRDKRRLVDKYVEFSVRKFYHHRSVGPIAEATWELMSSPTRFAALFSSSMAMDLRHVQRVDDDTVVFYRRIDRRRESAGTVSKSIFLISRIRTALGYLIILRLCDTARHRYERRLLRDISELENETWHDVCSWVLFEALGHGEHVQFTFGGRFDTSAATSQFWMLEALLLSLRWEASVIGPLFQLLVNE